MIKTDRTAAAADSRRRKQKIKELLASDQAASDGAASLIDQLMHGKYSKKKSPIVQASSGAMTEEFNLCWLDQESLLFPNP
jgi:hypothetical protein